MAEGLLSRLREEYKISRASVKQRQREIEIELHPEKKHWDERMWQMEDYFHDLKDLALEVIAAPIFSFLTAYAYESDFNMPGNLLGLGAVMMTCSLWHSYKRIRSSPFYNS